MIPGIVSKLSEEIVASATIISVRREVVVLTGTTSIATINPPNQGGFSGVIWLLPKDGAVATTAAGNIAKAMTIPQFQSCCLIWSKTQQKWYPSAIS